jgi:hypothetical protein
LIMSKAMSSIFSFNFPRCSPILKAHLLTKWPKTFGSSCIYFMFVICRKIELILC